YHFGTIHEGTEMDLKGATVLVTGGSNGIGHATAKLLGQAGARGGVTRRDKKRRAAAAEALGAHPIHADVAREADVLRSYQEVFQAFGHLHVLINNAGFAVLKPLADT